jgi:hypothetical protein
MQLRLGASSTTKTPDCCNLSIQQMCSVALLGSAVVRLDGGINHALNLIVLEHCKYGDRQRLWDSVPELASPPDMLTKFSKGSRFSPSTATAR